MTELREAVGKRIRQLRKQKKMSQERLAEMTELSVTFIGTMERGKNCPSLKSCGLIAEALGVALPELFEFGELSPEAQELREFYERLRQSDRRKVKQILEIARVILREEE